LGCGDPPKDGFAVAHLAPLSLDFAPRKSVYNREYTDFKTGPRIAFKSRR
jgi:hypothetical protein